MNFISCFAVFSWCFILCGCIGSSELDENGNQGEKRSLIVVPDRPIERSSVEVVSDEVYLKKRHKVLSSDLKGGPSSNG
jgi:hypothetical protein